MLRCQHHISPHNPYLNGPTLLEKSHKCYNETLRYIYKATLLCNYYGPLTFGKILNPKP